MSNPEHSQQPLRILHVLRAPLGGLFRHVVDLTRAQAARGHLVGMVTDSLTGGARARDLLDELRPALALGVYRIAMRRNPHPSDIMALASHMNDCQRAHGPLLPVLSALEWAKGMAFGHIVSTAALVGAAGLFLLLAFA